MLNIMQRMSGIATMTHKYAEKLKGTNTRVLDTRKTTPGMRILEKMAVKIGGGVNHRIGLFDMILAEKTIMLTSPEVSTRPLPVPRNIARRRARTSR